ncbi:MAG: hypothetical protein LBR56_00955 [Sporomusaceae bacterium]|jgi:hypothetical protein|nr:hypothetical protein [Sporomusaceae bacterium]
MNMDQRLNIVENNLHNLEKICAAKQADLKNTMQKVDENRELTKTIHQLALNMGELTSQVKLQGEKIERIVAHNDASLKAHGERIGALENQGSKRWEAIIMKVISLSVATGIGALIAKM